MTRGLLVLMGVTICAAVASGADWPMWRFDAGRGNCGSNSLPAQLHLQWVRQLPEAQSAWPASQPRLQFDKAPQPIVLGTHIIVPSTVNDSLTCYDTQAGGEQWRYYADAPIRFAPVGYKNRVYFVSDDGFLYCVQASDGKLVWKLNGGPRQRWIIGNHRLVSSWPARGGPVLHQGKIYFAASIWPFMGIFIHCVDPDTGEIVWTNSGDGTNFTVQPHGAPSFATAAPQGHLAAAGDHLIVPGGRSTPAVYDARTGELVHFKFDGRNGGSDVVAAMQNYFVGGQTYRTNDGKNLGAAKPLLIDAQALVSLSGNTAKGESATGKIKETTKVDRKGKKKKSQTFVREKLFQIRLEGNAGDVMMKAGTRIYTGGAGKVTAFDFDGNSKTDKRQPIWSAVIKGNVHHMLAAADRLFVVTEDCRLYCFGPEKRQPVLHELKTTPLAVKTDSVTQNVTKLLSPKQNGGFAVVAGIGSGRLIEEFLRQSELNLLVVDPDSKKVDNLRRKLQVAGVYGKRITVYCNDPATFKFPPYLASLICFGENVSVSLPRDQSKFQKLIQVLRPYGGRMVLEIAENQHRQLAQFIKAADSNLQLRRANGMTILERAGALAGSGDWTHQYGNAGQTGVSRDKIVKAPLGLLWFGGASNDKILPRHGHGPSPQVAGGRLFIEGPDMLRAVDVYSGRVLWEKTLKNFGKYYNTTRHFPGAGEIGSNYVSLPDQVYAVYGNAILELDAATGKLNREFKLKVEAGKEAPNWGFIGVHDDLLIATSSPVPVKISQPKKSNISKLLGDVSKFLRSAKTVIKRNEQWQYLAGGDPKGDWTSPEFDAKGWKTGPAGFGFGDGDDKTTISMRNKFQRIYIRRQFDGKAIKDSADLVLAINYDDAFIAYLNGKEVARSGVKRGRGAKATGISSHEADGFEVFLIKDWRKLIMPGKNVIAIEGHNSSAGSSDFTLDPFLLTRSKVDKVAAPKEPVKAPIAAPLPSGRYASGSKRIVVFDRRGGKLLWSREAVFNFRHNNIAAGAGKIFCIDGMTDARRQALARRGVTLTGQPTLYALDARTGQVIWSKKQHIFGTFLSYSEEHDTLVQAGSKYRDRAGDEVSKGMAAYRGTDGALLWQQKDISYGGPVLLWRDKIVTNGSGGFALAIKSGEKTGWKYERKYGCNTALGSEHLLTFRSGCAGFYDLANNSGTGNLGGFRSSCTNNLIVANGVLNAPDYTRTCSCAYQNQTSLALVHMPEAEFWTFGGVGNKGQIGINFGAPGDRRAANGTLWQAKTKSKIAPKELRQFRIHSSVIKSGEPKWVAACGVEGIERIAIGVTKGKKYQVRLTFLEPEKITAGQRVFDVKLQGKTVLPQFDVVQAAGGSRKALIREFVVEATTGEMLLEVNSLSKMPPVISGVEVLER